MTGRLRLARWHTPKYIGGVTVDRYGLVGQTYKPGTEISRSTGLGYVSGCVGCYH